MAENDRRDAGEQQQGKGEPLRDSVEAQGTVEPTSRPVAADAAAPHAERTSTLGQLHGPEGRERMAADAPEPGSTGLAANDRDAGDTRRKQYDAGADLVSQTD